MSLKNRKNKEDLANRKRLTEACASGDLEAVEQLAGIVKNLNRAVDGRTPLTAACRWNHPEVAAYLIAKGADVNSAATDQPALHSAILSRDRLMVRMLLQAGANPNGSCKEHGQLALELALFMQRGDIAVELLNFGARIDNLTEDGAQLGQLLAWSGSDELLDAVCKKPQWFAVIPSGGMPLLHSLAYWGGVKYLERAALDGADMNAFASEDMRTTPLHQACMNGGGKCVEALLNFGADVDAIDGFGYTPLQLALLRVQAKAALAIVKAKRRSLHEPLYGKTLHEWFAENAEALEMLESAITESAASSLMEAFGDATLQSVPESGGTTRRGLIL